MKRWFQAGLVAMVLGLAGCATTPSLSVNVPRMTQDWPQGEVSVVASSGEAQWAVTQALAERQWRVVPASAYRLTVYQNERSMLRSLDDPFCGPFGPSPRFRGGWGGWYGPYGPYGWNQWGCSPPRIQSYQVREMTWVLTRQGDTRALWSATARETSPRGPALELARKLAAGLDLAPVH